MIKDIFDLNHTIAKDLFLNCEYGYEVLKDIKTYTIELGKSLNKEEFLKKVSDQCLLSCNIAHPSCPFRRFCEEASRKNFHQAVQAHYPAKRHSRPQCSSAFLNHSCPHAPRHIYHLCMPQCPKKACFRWYMISYRKSRHIPACRFPAKIR